MISFNAQFNATWTGIDINTLEGVMSARPTSKKKRKKKKRARDKEPDISI